MRRRTPRLGVLLSAMTAALLLLGLVSPALPARAQSDNGLVSDTEYESPQFDFTLAWADPWSVSADSVDSQSGKYDSFQLESPNALAQIILLFPTDDAQAYLDVLVQGAADGKTDFQELGRDSGNGYVSATVEFSLDTQSGPLVVREYIEVGDLAAQDGSDALFSGTFMAPADGFADEWASLEENVQRDGRDPLYAGTPEGIKAGGSTTPKPPARQTEKTPTAESGNGGQGGIDGNTFTGPQTGFTVEWDDQMWEASDLSDRNGDGVELASDTAKIQLITVDLPGGDVKSCVTDAADAVKGGDGISNFKRATQLEPPDAPRGAFGRLYTYEQGTGTRAETYVHYIECRPIADSTYLVITFVTAEADYEAEVENFLDVSSTVDTSGQGSSGNTQEPSPEPTKRTGGLGRNTGDEPTPEPTDEPTKTSTTKANGNGLEGNVYSGRDFAFTVTFDDQVWTAEELTPDTGYEGVKLTNDNATAFVEAFGDFTGQPEDCVRQTGEGRADLDGVSNVRESTRLELPKTSRDAAASVYTYTYAGQNGDVDFAEYIECRPLDEADSVLRTTVLVLADNYADQIPAMEDLLAGVEVGAKSASSSGNSGNSNSGNSGTSGDLPGVKGNSYTSPQFDFSISWSNDWEPVSATDEQGGTTLILSNGTATAFVFGGDFDRDPATCVGQLADVVSNQDGVSNVKIVTNDQGEPQEGASRTSGYGFYSLTKGGEDYFDYIYCQPASDDSFVVVVVYEMPVASIATELQNLDDLLGNLEVA